MDGEGLTKLKTGRKQTGHLYYIQMKLYPGQKTESRKCFCTSSSKENWTTTRRFRKLSAIIIKDANIKLQKAQEKHKQLATSLGPKVTKHNKSWSQYSTQYKSQQKKQIASNVCISLKFTENTHFQPSNVEMRNIETNEMLSIHQDGSITLIKPQRTSENNNTITKQTLYVKERFNISDKAYHELSIVHPSLPRWLTLNKTSKEMDCNSTICPTSGPILGIQQSLKYGTARFKL